jgi:hypothetical protein
VTYRCGISGFGVERPPTITCDGCGVRVEIRSLPPKWFLDGKAKPGWKLVRHEEKPGGGFRMRSDYCPECKDRTPNPASGEEAMWRLRGGGLN